MTRPLTTTCSPRHPGWRRSRHRSVLKKVPSSAICEFSQTVHRRFFNHTVRTQCKSVCETGGERERERESSYSSGFSRQSVPNVLFSRPKVCMAGPLRWGPELSPAPERERSKERQRARERERERYSKRQVATGEFEMVYFVGLGC